MSAPILAKPVEMEPFRLTLLLWFVVLLLSLVTTVYSEKQARVEEEIPLFLPLPSDVASSDDASSRRQVSWGETVSFDELGPIIVNLDGSARRISNWQELSKAEQEASWRVIAKRNKKRVEMMQQQEQHHDSQPAKPQEQAAMANAASAPLSNSHSLNHSIDDGNDLCT